MFTKIINFIKERAQCKKRFQLLHNQLAHLQSREAFAEYYKLKQSILTAKDRKSALMNDLWLAEEMTEHFLMGKAPINHSAIMKHLRP